MPSSPPPLLLSLLNKVRRQRGEKMFVTWLSWWRSCSLRHGLHVFVFVCMCAFLGLQVWKIYCGWELKMSSFWPGIFVCLLVCESTQMDMRVSFWSSVITCRYLCMHARAPVYFMYSYMVELQGEWALWISKPCVCFLWHPYRPRSMTALLH